MEHSDPASWRALLQQITFFQGLEPSALDAVAEAARVHSVPRGDTFYNQDEPVPAFYVLTAGRVCLAQFTPDGQQVIERFVTPGEGFALIAVLVDIPAPVTAEAVDDCVALAWDGSSMAALMERFPPLAFNGMRLLASRVREMQDRMRELATERVERRIAHTLLRLARQAGRTSEDGIIIDLPLSRQNLAELTGTTLYTVSRTLRRWHGLGVIEATREHIRITDHARLLAFTDGPHDVLA